MAIFSAMFPILPGKKERIKEIGAGLMGEYKADFAASQKELGVPVESWHIQETPDGAAFLLVYLECADPLDMFHRFSEGQSPSDKYLKDGVLECTGFDLNQKFPGLPSQAILDFRA